MFAARKRVNQSWGAKLVDGSAECGRPSHPSSCRGDSKEPGAPGGICVTSTRARTQPTKGGPSPSLCVATDLTTTAKLSKQAASDARTPAASRLQCASERTKRPLFLVTRGAGGLNMAWLQTNAPAFSGRILSAGIQPRRYERRRESIVDRLRSFSKMGFEYAHTAALPRGRPRRAPGSVCGCVRFVHPPAMPPSWRLPLPRGILHSEPKC